LTESSEAQHNTLAESDDGWLAWVRRGFFLAVGFWMVTIVVVLVASLLLLAGGAAMSIM